ncbi:YrrS family protein [Schinkia azotoformans]|uniref:YrrS family protein n=1 Tax=Schinkia azotoformans TaxID=1454 RepID=UPI002DBC3D7E|nr:YrrS family protein [Schinkia azotoformans]MEC1773719.1 YrrS family protein [Schinkia azotoformans]MED4366184.1 YrrS family protein [Schinkia azotoformans]
MKYDFKDLYEGPRFQNRAKKRKIKLIMTGIVAIIGIVLIIGIINIFSGGSEEANVAPEEPNETEQAVDDNDEEMADDAEIDDESLSIGDNEATQNETITEKVSPNKPETSKGVKNSDAASDSTKKENSESKVIGSVEENWEPVGTEQEGEHVTDFTKGSQDWVEMTQAVSSATGLSNDNMIVWWMGNGGASNKAISTVSTKDKGTYYRVQLEWVNGSGWKPVKVEEVEGNDHQPGTESATSTETTKNR